MKLMKRTPCLTLSLLLALALPIQAAAETYNLEDGSVVTTDAADQYVAQGERRGHYHRPHRQGGFDLVARAAG